MKNNSQGFTLVELLLYVSIVGVIIFSVAGLLFLLFESRVKNQTIAEVEQQGIQVMQIITQTVRNVSTISSPTQGVNAVSLTVGASTFDLSGGTIRADAIALTNARVTASNISFYNLSRSGTDGTIRIQYTLTHLNPSGRNEYDYQKTFYGSASLR